MISRTPYVLHVPVFRFRALTAAAERLSLGGDREVALATLVAARLVADAVASSPEDLESQRERAAASRLWFASHPLPTAARTAFQQLADAVQRADAVALGAAWERVLAFTSKVLDAPARAELRAVVLRPFSRDAA